MFFSERSNSTHSGTKYPWIPLMEDTLRFVSLWPNLDTSKSENFHWEIGSLALSHNRESIPRIARVDKLFLFSSTIHAIFFYERSNSTYSGTKYPWIPLTEDTLRSISLSPSLDTPKSENFHWGIENPLALSRNRESILGSSCK